MARALVIVNGPADRRKAADWVMKSPAGTRIEFKASKRSLDQNSRMWAMLTDVATQQHYNGVKLVPDDWKLVFLDGLRRAQGDELRLVPNLDNNGFVNLGRSSSDLSKDEMSDLIEIIAAWGSEHGVVFHDERATEAAA